MALAILRFDERAGEVARIVNQYLDYMLSRHRAGTISEAGLRKAKDYLVVYQEDFGHLDVDDCEQSDLEQWLLDHPEWDSPYSKSDAIGSVVTCFRWAARNRKKTGVRFCPYCREKRLIGELVPREDITQAEYRKLMVAARLARSKCGRRLPTRDQFRLFIFFMWRSFSRTCEARLADWGDLNFDTGAIKLYEHKTAKTSGEPRIIVLEPKLLWLLRRVWEIRRRPGPEKPILVNSRNRRWTKDLCKIFKLYADRAGIRKELTPYSIRHGAAVDLAEAGGSDRQIADMLGHKGTQRVQVYVRRSRQRIDHLKRIQALRRKKRD